MNLRDACLKAAAGAKYNPHKAPGTMDAVHTIYDNEALLAAAPDLLAACKAFVETWSRTNQREKLDVARRMAEAAIEKAEGE